MSLLSARDLCAAPPADGTRGSGAPDEVVVRGFSLELDPGQWVALRGPNGSGKTTLMLVLSGLWPAASGTLLLDGAPLGPGADPALRSQVAVVMQDPSSQLVQPTVRDEIGFAALNLGVPPDAVAERVGRWVRRLALEADVERDPQELSAGRQQLVLLAAALVAQPRLLLADEPICHLDRSARDRALDVIAKEVSSGLAVVWVTQDRVECGRATRVIDVGPDDNGEPIVEMAVERNDGESIGRLEVEPWRGGDGPSIRTEEPLSILLPSAGVTAIEGPNGVGKSVLLGAAAGVSPLPQVRVVRYGGPWLAPILSCQYPELEIFEESVADEIVFAAVSRGVAVRDAHERAVAALDALGVPASRLIGRRTWTLSGGEKRIVSLVGALIAPTSLVVLDEPTAGLDPERRSRLARLVDDVAQSSSVLVASQDSEWLGAISARRIGLGGPWRAPAASHSEKTD